MSGEFRQFQADRAVGGAEYALARRVAHYAGVGPLQGALGELRGEDERVRGELDRLRKESERLRMELERLRGEGERLRGEGDCLRGELEALRCEVDHRFAPLADLPSWAAGAEDRLAGLERLASIRAVMDWVAQARLLRSPLVSVVLPTRNRSGLLPRAVASIAAQHYPHWELLIVDDCSDDDTPSVIDSFTDPRIRALRTDHRGVCGARNVALRHASSELIAYLDDDNTMHPGWLKAVVWAFEQRPDVDALYGAFVVDDVERVNRHGSGSLPTLFLHPYDRKALLRGNLADISAIAHRAGLAEAFFDEDLREMGDWDLLLRITTHREPLVLPAIACFYFTDAPDRLSGGETYHADAERVRTKNSTAAAPTP